MSNVSRKFCNFNLSAVSLCVFLSVSGCTGFLRKSHGNAEGFAGVKPVPGTYYAVHPDSACANSATAPSGHQKVIEVTEEGEVRERGACETTFVDVILSAVSQYGREPFGGSGMLVAGDLIFDQRAVAPTAAATGPSTRAWVSQRLGTIYYDVILINGEGPAATPVATANVFVTEGTGSNKKTTLALAIPVGGTSPDTDHQVFTGENFSLRLQRVERRATATLSASIDGKSVQLTLLKGYSTYFAPPPAAQARPAVTLAGGTTFSCGTLNGSAYCWGLNDSAQCGIGLAGMQPVTSPTPVVSLGSGVTSLSAGDRHACAIKSGKAYCWGANTDGQIGNGGTPLIPQLSPYELPGSNATAVAAGPVHSCAIFGGKAFCWGQNITGQLGTGDIVPISSPVAVVGITEDLASISVGLGHTCALSVGGEAYCWGDNVNGELGRGIAGAHSPFPQKISGVRFTSLSTYGGSNCGITVQGKVSCWGANYTGQVSGDGVTSPSFPSPQVLASVAGIPSRIAMGAGFVCALQAGQPVCWGANQNGQLGVGNINTPLPVGNVVGLTDAYELAAGGAHMLAYSLGYASSWGENMNFQLGDGTMTSRSLAAPFDFP